jgi:hypothetical protein
MYCVWESYRNQVSSDIRDYWQYAFETFPEGWVFPLYLWDMQHVPGKDYEDEKSSEKAKNSK